MEKAEFELAIADVNEKIAKLAQSVEEINVNVNNIAQQQTKTHVQAACGHLENTTVSANRRPEGISDSDNLFTIRDEIASGQRPVDPSPHNSADSAYSSKR